LIASVALAVVVLVGGTSAYAAERSARTPDPAPASSLVRPDPYPANSSAPVASRSPATAVVARASSPESTGSTPGAAATGHDRTSRAAVRAANRTAARKAAKRRNAKPERPGELAAGVFAIPGHQAPRVAALTASPAADLRRVPVGAALAVALVVLLSGALLTGVSRAVAR
jgi:hypothetical protein